MYKTVIRVAALCALAVCSWAAFCQTVNPHDVLRQIAELRTKRAQEAREAGTTLNAAAIQAEVAAIAKGATKGVEVAKIEGRDGYAWAQLFQLAGEHKNACDAAEKFLASKPEPAQQFAAQTLMLASCNELGEAHMLADLIATIKPPNAVSAVSLASIVLARYVDTIQARLGVEAALKALATVEKMIVLDQLAENQRASGEQALSRIQGRRNLLTIRGAPAPELAVERTIGDFKGLDAYKGKIVLLKFYAHW